MPPFRHQIRRGAPADPHLAVDRSTCRRSVTRSPAALLRGRRATGRRFLGGGVAVQTDPVDVTASLEADVEPGRLFEIVGDLGTYPDWLDIVARAEPLVVDEGAAPAWEVDLRGQLGPLRRSKRLRMVRTDRDSTDRAVFARAELDGRRHAAWVLDARIRTDVPSSAGEGPHGPAGAPAVTRLEMRLHYGGTLWVPLLDRLLSEEIERSRERLVALAGASG